MRPSKVFCSAGAGATLLMLPPGVQIRRGILYLVRECCGDKDGLTAAFTPFPAVVYNALHGFSELRLHELVHLQQWLLFSEKHSPLQGTL